MKALRALIYSFLTFAGCARLSSKKDIAESIRKPVKIRREPFRFAFSGLKKRLSVRDAGFFNGVLPFVLESIFTPRTLPGKSSFHSSIRAF